MKQIRNRTSMGLISTGLIKESKQKEHWIIKQQKDVKKLFGFAFTYLGVWTFFDLKKGGKK